MSRNKVEFQLSAEDTKAMAAAARLLREVRQVGDEYGKTGQKGELSFGKVGDSIAKLAMSFVGPAAALKVMMESVDLLKQKMEAITQAQERAASVSKTYGEAFGKIVSNIPGISATESTSIDQRLRGIAGARALGEGGLVKLADAYATIQTSIPLAPQAAKFAAVEETAQLLELSPTENAAGIGLGIAKIMEASGYKYSANQAQNLLRMQQTLGLVKEVAPIGQGIPRLGAAAQMGETSLADMQAFAAYLTQAMGDTGGEESVTAISQMVAQLMTRSGDVEKRIGIRPTGNVWNRISQIRSLYQAGGIGEDALGELFPVISRGGGGKMAIMGLLGSGWDKLGEYRDLMTSPDVVQGDFTESDIATMRDTLGAQEWQFQRRAMESRVEGKKAGSEEDAREVFFREAFIKKLQSERRPQGYIDAAMPLFDLFRQEGYSLELAETMARDAGPQGTWPLLRKVLPDAALLTGKMMMNWHRNVAYPLGYKEMEWAEPKKDMAYYMQTLVQEVGKTNAAITAQTERRTTPRSTLATGANL